MANNDTTTIVLGKKIKNKLDEFKVHPRQSYSEVIENLIKKVKKK